MIAIQQSNDILGAPMIWPCDWIGRSIPTGTDYKLDCKLTAEMVRVHLQECENNMMILFSIIRSMQTKQAVVCDTPL